MIDRNNGQIFLDILLIFLLLLNQLLNHKIFILDSLLWINFLAVFDNFTRKPPVLEFLRIRATSKWLINLISGWYDLLSWLICGGSVYFIKTIAFSAKT